MKIFYIGAFIASVFSLPTSPLNRHSIFPRQSEIQSVYHSVLRDDISSEAPKSYTPHKFTGSPHGKVQKNKGPLRPSGKGYFIPSPVKNKNPRNGKVYLLQNEKEANIALLSKNTSIFAVGSASTFQRRTSFIHHQKYETGDNFVQKPVHASVVHSEKIPRLLDGAISFQHSETSPITPKRLKALLIKNIKLQSRKQFYDGGRARSQPPVLTRYGMILGALKPTAQPTGKRPLLHKAPTLKEIKKILPTAPKNDPLPKLSLATFGKMSLISRMNGPFVEREFSDQTLRKEQKFKPIKLMPIERIP